ncbi:MAG: hypothetical protein HYS07_10790 [Chlamydiae bacterium]|nr:hypothetical protein [Chlamydiota bacterium]MBI3276872.1 hypothetical protein [Chlamydiota bacterium]
MQKIDRALAEVRRWKRKVSEKTLKMSLDEVVLYFNNVESDPKWIDVSRSREVGFGKKAA